MKDPNQVSLFSLNQCKKWRKLLTPFLFKLKKANKGELSEGKGTYFGLLFGRNFLWFKAIPGLFFVFSIQLTVNIQYTFYRWLDSNCGPQESGATTLPTGPRPLPGIFLCYSSRKTYLQIVNFHEIWIPQSTYLCIAKSNEFNSKNIAKYCGYRKPFETVYFNRARRIVLSSLSKATQDHCTKYCQWVD